jgi:hypothetical protein
MMAFGSKTSHTRKEDERRHNQVQVEMSRGVYLNVEGHNHYIH